MAGSPAYHDNVGMRDEKHPQTALSEMPEYRPNPVHEIGHSEQRPVAVPGMHEVEGSSNWQR